MNLNLFKQFNNAKISYINLLCRCCIALALCGLLLFPSIVANGATGGGGGTRGGGAGRVNYQLPNYMNLTKGYVVTSGSGDLAIRGETDKSFVGYKRIDNSTRVDTFTVTAEQKGVMTVVTEFPSEYWLSFYNFGINGTTKHIGSSPKFVGYSMVEVPAKTTYIVVHSVTAQSGTLILTAQVPEGEEAPVIEKPSTFNKYDNVWRLGFRTGTQGMLRRSETPFDSSTGTAITAVTEYFYRGNKGQTFTLGMNYSYGYIHYNFVEYDFEYRYLGEGSIAPSAGETVTYTLKNESTKYFKIYIDTYGVRNQTAKAMHDMMSIQGFGSTDVSSSAYQIDNSSIHNIVNNHQYSTIHYNIVSGDNSPIIIIDGDGNTVTIPGPSPITTVPPNPVPTGDEDSDDDDSGGGFWDTITDLFGGIGEALEGLMKLIMIPINLILSAITTLTDTLANTVEATVGLSEFMGSMFGWLPPPLPGLIVTFISGLLVVAFINFLRG